MAKPCGLRRARAERGAVVVEFTFVATVLVVLVLGVFEIGSAWTDNQTIVQAARTGARVGSQMGTEGEADSQALLSTQAALGSLSGQITKIVIYDADSNGDMPVACETAPAGYNGGSACNVYDATSLANLTTPSWWGSGTSCGTADVNWCSATDRDASQTGATYLGVYVEIERPYLTGLFGGGTQTVSERTVMRIEPEI